MDPDELEALAKRQADVVRRAQLRATGVTDSGIRSQLRARRWQRLTDSVVVLHNGPMTVEQQRWAAVLAGHPRAALGGRTALALAGLKNWEHEQIALLVPQGRRLQSMSGVPVTVHQTRRYRNDDVIGSLARTTVERSAIDGAGWSERPRTAVGLLAAVVQQRLTTADRLLAALDGAGPIRHRDLLRVSLHDIAGGADALSEIDFGKLCQRFGLPAPRRQVVRCDGFGLRRYLDALLEGDDGTTVSVEIDGAIHVRADRWDADLDRANELLLGGDRILRFSSTTIRVEPRRVADQLRRALGMPRLPP